jgi:hypothetical protein
MVREEQLSLCFEPEASEVPPVPPRLSSETPVRQQSTASVLCFGQFKRHRASTTDANSVRLLEKIARKVKYF